MKEFYISAKDFNEKPYHEFIDDLKEAGAPIRYETEIPKEDLCHDDIIIYGNLEAHTDINGGTTYVWDWE